MRSATTSAPATKSTMLQRVSAPRSCMVWPPKDNPETRRRVEGGCSMFYRMLSKAPQPARSTRSAPSQFQRVSFSVPLTQSLDAKDASDSSTQQYTAIVCSLVHHISYACRQKRGPAEYIAASLMEGGGGSETDTIPVHNPQSTHHIL